MGRVPEGCAGMQAAICWLLRWMVCLPGSVRAPVGTGLEGGACEGSGAEDGAQIRERPRPTTCSTQMARERVGTIPVPLAVFSWP